MDNMASCKFLLVLILVYCAFVDAQTEYTVNQNNSMVITSASLYNATNIFVTIESHEHIKVEWLLRGMACMQEIVEIEAARNGVIQMFNTPQLDLRNIGYKEVHYQVSEGNNKLDGTKAPIHVLTDESCGQWTKHLVDKEDTEGAPDNDKEDTEGAPDNNKNDNDKSNGDSDAGSDSDDNTLEQTTESTTTTSTTTTTATTTTKAPSTSTTVKGDLTARKKREATKKNKESSGPAPPEKETFHINCGEKDADKQNKTGSNDLAGRVTQTWEDGFYMFFVKVSPVRAGAKFNATVKITMKHPVTGQLRAVEWPLLIFYGIMCAVYVVFGVAWLVMLAMNWRDILRIQYWIGAVIVLGMLEKAVFFSEYESRKSSALNSDGALIFAELVSCLKRSLSRMLVVIVSMGFGIVKPRLGPMLHRVLGVGALYFVISAVEGIMRVNDNKGASKHTLLASIPLAVLDAGICYWVFTSLLETTRTLRLRRNVVKLTLYRQFTHVLIAVVVASVAFMVWVMVQYKFVNCSDRAWKEMWIQEAVWHLLFSAVMLAIIILWRPTANNQRYAFSPLLDGADDGADEPMMNEGLADGLKNRKTGDGTQIVYKDNNEKVEDDLRWIEENIPATLADNALPSLLESEEEIETTRFEMGKMD